jgi:CDP-paratose 2-epimerase
MSIAIVTGASGLIGSETVRFLHGKGMTVIGIDNNLRAYFFGSDGSTDWNAKKMQMEFNRYVHENIDIRDQTGINRIFEKYGKDISIVVHCAAQPSHDWAAREPVTDFTVNALATLYLLEATRNFAPEASFIFTSTNKVYGDTPNFLPLVEKEHRWECASEHQYSEHGIDESMSIDQSKHSVFGASKVAADVMCQEYGRYFGLKTAVFRGGCLTGPAHSGAELHGFLAYLVKCQMTGRPYSIFGYKGKQVRDNIHSNDLVHAFWNYHQSPRPGEVYNIGGSRHSNCSMLEAINIIRDMTGKELNFTVKDEARSGDHIWWISDVRKFREHYPQWNYKYDIEGIIREIVQAVSERENIKIP